MSNKRWDKLNELDQIIQRTVRAGMDVGVLVTIEFISGFELFNTRPYHNYDTWSQGYRITGCGQRGEQEDLDDAVREWAAKVEASRAPKIQGI